MGALMAEVDGILCPGALASAVPPAAVVGGRDDRRRAIAPTEPTRALLGARRWARKRQAAAQHVGGPWALIRRLQHHWCRGELGGALYRLW